MDLRLRTTGSEDDASFAFKSKVRRLLSASSKITCVVA
jgi:hypothetical protein